MSPTIVEKHFTDGSIGVNVHLAVIDEQGEQKTLVIGATSREHAQSIAHALAAGAAWAEIGVDSL